MYSKMYFLEWVLPAVLEWIEAEGEDHQPRITVVKEVTMELYAGEDDKVKAAVAARMSAAQGEAVDEDITKVALHTPQQYQEYAFPFALDNIY
jgi:hypothetical protein